MHAIQNAKILNIISSVSSTNIGESIKGIRYTGYCNNCYNSSGINLHFLAAYRSHYNYGCWVFHISMVYEAKTME
jgi:hypothetical protein